MTRTEAAVAVARTDDCRETAVGGSPGPSFKGKGGRGRGFSSSSGATASGAAVSASRRTNHDVSEKAGHGREVWR